MVRSKESLQMTTNSPRSQAPRPNRAVLRWLLDSDPSIRWQVVRDLNDAPAIEVAAEGSSARLLSPLIQVIAAPR
jgi:hypothetical protein